ncbi:hypothetical protein [Streptomyces sp. F001]|uniref:hypothetical protein n=1 Tax=Streptomyces sp. F001 TaxID=1510026 RepID=UPI00101E7989|nr:hypothetical protein [Streptomyces sp. F001]
MPVPESVRALVPGTIRYKAATDLAILQDEFEDNPVKVLVGLVRELGERVTITALRKCAESMGIAASMSLDEWGHMRQLLLAEPQIRQDGKSGLRWSEGGSKSESPSRQQSAPEALRELASKPRKIRARTKQSLSAAVSAGLKELSPYELLAAHALDVPVTEWPQQWTETRPEQVPEEIRLVAVEHITEMSRARSRIVLPGTEPGPAARKAADIPSSLGLLPLLVPLVAMPASSLAADKAARALSGEHAWNALRAAMDYFEQALSVGSDPKDTSDREERLAPLSARARELLKTVLMRRPKEDDLPWRDFAEEMASRACALLADPRTRQQPNGTVRAWAQHVAAHPAIPTELREAARTVQVVAAVEAADAVDADSTGIGERTKESREVEAVRETLTGDAEQTKSTGVEEGSDADAEVGEAATFAPRDAAVAADDPPQDVTNDVPDETPEAAQEPERNPQAEIAALTRLLEEERSNADAARAEHERERRAASAALAEAEAAANRLRLRVEDEEKHRAEAEARAHATEAKWESAQRDLEEAAQRAEAMTRQLRRRDDELRQSRQTARGASQAQLRQARIDTLRVLAAVLAEVADQAVHEGEKEGLANALYRRVLARAAAAGVLDIGVLGEETDYDPAVHRAPGGPAARVVVERPGFVWQGPREPGPVVLEQAIVRRAE